MRKCIQITFSLLFLSVMIYSQDSSLEVEGRITTDSLLIKNLPAFRAEIKEDSLISMTSDTIVLDNIWVDDGNVNHSLTSDNDGSFDVETGIFKVPRNGIYRFEIHFNFNCDRFGDDLILIFLSVQKGALESTIKSSGIYSSFGNIYQNNSGPKPQISQGLHAILKLEKMDKVKLKFSFPVEGQEAFCKYFDYGNGFIAEGLILEKGSSFSGYLISDY